MELWVARARWAEVGWESWAHFLERAAAVDVTAADLCCRVCVQSQSIMRGIFDDVVEPVYPGSDCCLWTPYWERSHFHLGLS